MRKLSIAAVLAVLSALAGTALGEPIIPNPPISTDYTDGDVDLHTSVTAITIDVIEDDTCLDAGPVTRVRGTISGVGQGGVTFALASGKLVDQTVGLDSVYDYTLDYEYLFPKGGKGSSRALVVSGAGSQGLVFSVGNPSVNGTAHRNGQRFLARPALLDHDAYFTANRSVRVNDAVCHYRDLVYNQDVSDAVQTTFSWLPHHAVGDPLPCAPANDAATMRDLTRAGQYIHEHFMGAAPRYTIGVGISAGTFTLMQINSGRSASEPSFPIGRRSGGNYLVPYDPSSGVIFDYVITRGLPAGSLGGFWNIDPEFPVSAPTVLLLGNADPRLVNPWAYLAAIAGPPEAPSSVVLDDWFRLYEWRGTPHRWGTDESVTVCGVSNSDLGPMGPWVGAMYDNARARLDKGQPEPQSRFAGHLDGAGQLVFEQTGGGTWPMVPFVDDPPGDELLNVGPPFFPVPHVPFDDQVANWKVVDARLPHGPAITPPLLSCRLGHYKISEGGGPTAQLPFLKRPPDLIASWTWDSFVDCMDQAMQALKAEGLYDTRVENAPTTAARFRPLFDGAGAGPH